MMPLKLKRGIDICPADERLFVYLYENKVATAEQIHRDIYPSYQRRSVQNRLANLTKNRLIKGKCYCGRGHKMIFSLSQPGFMGFIKPLGGKSKPEFGSQAPYHDLGLLEIRWMLSQSKHVKKYVPENLIGHGPSSFTSENFEMENIRPDAVIEVDLKSKVFCLALEYECARKYAERYKDLFRRYYNAKSIAGILYVCNDENLLKYIQGIEKGVVVDETPKFYYSNFSKWQQSKDKLFTNIRNSCITLG